MKSISNAAKIMIKKISVSVVSFRSESFNETSASGLSNLRRTKYKNGVQTTIHIDLTFI